MPVLSEMPISCIFCLLIWIIWRACHRNLKVLSLISSNWQAFEVNFPICDLFMSTWWMDCKKIKIIFFSRWLFEIIQIIRFEMCMDSRINLKIFLGHDINYPCYLSIWPFMHHPWFPTRKASKLIFVCFQLAGEWYYPAIWKQSHGHHPASWKQINVSFEAFLVGNQGWRIKGQMLR